MEHGDPDALYDLTPEKRQKALTYLLAKARRDGRLVVDDASADDHLVRLFGPGAGG